VSRFGDMAVELTLQFHTHDRIKFGSYYRRNLFRQVTQEIIDEQ
jgi:hypothetical protein